MAGKTLDLEGILIEDHIGCHIARKWVEWNTFRQPSVDRWDEVRRYVYATDTTSTTNASLPWRNKSTLPKICQIRDNLYSNYVATVFPKRKWLRWQASDEQSAEKRESITQYMNWVIGQEQFKIEAYKLILDYIDYGNAFGMIEWKDERVSTEEKEQVGYVGPMIKRISPLDIVFNATASSFDQAPKIIRSLHTMGELKAILERLSNDDNQVEYEEIFNYVKRIRSHGNSAGTTAAGTTDLAAHDSLYQIDGFGTYRQYLDSDYVEILTFYGDLYDRENDEFYKNHQIMVIDRHKVISKKPNPSMFGHAPIYHSGWRKRQDNIWCMGPLENLVGMQYQIDKINNAKADCLDLIMIPPLKVKGVMDDFEWGPFIKINTGDEGDVEPLMVPYQVLQLNNEIQFYMNMMEETAGAPKEAMGFRSPGEKTKYEVQRMENASARIFQNKCSQLEEELIERLLNGCLEMAKRKLTGMQTIPVFNDEFSFTTFATLTAADITGTGTLKPIGARHFAEKADTVQNLTQFFGSPIGQDPSVRVHFSGKVLAKSFEDLLDITDYGMVQPFVRMDEDAEGQRLAQQHQVQNQMQLQTPTGMTPDDAQVPFAGVQ